MAQQWPEELLAKAAAMSAAVALPGGPAGASGPMPSSRGELGWAA